MRHEISDILREDGRRVDAINSPFNAITGEGSVGERFLFRLSDFMLAEQWLPVEMKENALIKKLMRYGSIRRFVEEGLKEEWSEEAKEHVVDTFIRVRIRYDFPFWLAYLIWIKNKSPEGGAETRFVATRPQRRLIECLEGMRKAGKPIRLILLKARQWGGSTTIQMYMAWIQMVHTRGLNSAIIAQVKDAATTIMKMFELMLSRYPTRLLHDIGESWSDNEVKWAGVGNSGNIHRVPQRKCNVQIGSAERPDSCRSGDFALVHCSEVGVWKRTEGKTPEEVAQGVTSGVLYRPLTFIAYESTAKGTGNFFHREYLAAKRGESQFQPLFVAWYEIGLYTLPFDAEDKDERLRSKEAFAEWLYANRMNGDTRGDREEPGKYLWWLWERCGATLEAINWYIHERTKFHEHSKMASEYPSDDVEAFAHSGERVFDMYQVEALRVSCRAPRYVGDVIGRGIRGKDALRDLRFTEDGQGLLWIWSKPDIDEVEKVTDRYAVVVDIGGRGRKSDWSVVVVFDRYYQMDGGRPMVVAQWYGHIDMDLLAWKAAQIAAYYDNALLVIESNTLETHDPARQVDGDQSLYILTQLAGVYPNLYARVRDETDVKEGAEVKYGFHTNVSTKPMIISVLIMCVREKLYVERDDRCLDEMLTYEKEGNKFNAIDGAHDDLLMTRAIGLHVCLNEMAMPRVVPRVKSAVMRPRRIVNEASM